MPLPQGQSCMPADPTRGSLLPNKRRHGMGACTGNPLHTHACCQRAAQSTSSNAETASNNPPPCRGSAAPMLGSRPPAARAGNQLRLACLGPQWLSRPCRRRAPGSAGLSLAGGKRAGSPRAVSLLEDTRCLRDARAPKQVTSTRPCTALCVPPCICTAATSALFLIPLGAISCPLLNW